jgi:hypothetical protein
MTDEQKDAIVKAAVAVEKQVREGRYDTEFHTLLLAVRAAEQPRWTVNDDIACFGLQRDGKYAGVAGDSSVVVHLLLSRIAQLLNEDDAKT